MPLSGLKLPVWLEILNGGFVLWIQIRVVGSTYTNQSTNHNSKNLTENEQLEPFGFTVEKINIDFEYNHLTILITGKPKTFKGFARP